jgi:hypothetical protein
MVGRAGREFEGDGMLLLGIEAKWMRLGELSKGDFLRTFPLAASGKQ